MSRFESGSPARLVSGYFFYWIYDPCTADHGRADIAGRRASGSGNMPPAASHG
ncbi:hypothetical protein GCM10009827_087250 [Dactylosporangium maewongense]|uniref:Uncharacterized protein n=1 Tax=Dactylosporangium maewongense TaxID=634393 RepID=A0ABN2C5Z9_9ACTN